MSYQVLARKWRPRIFREMVGQEHVLQALINALDHNRLHHAYLFTGTRGVGKTTIARILAKCLNCETGVSSEPCGQCSACREIAEGRFVDLIEVDAASRTKVEDTRELLENVQYAPTRGRYKVYLIDEVHMLSNSSFNALLKTLEEPPPHVKFLLATTDPQKLPMTILSRCLQFNLKNMNPERIVQHLKFVLEKELVPFEESALWQLGRSADGSMRDAMSLTDQAISYGSGKITEAEVRAMLGTIDQQAVYEIVTALAAQDGGGVLAAVEALSEQAPDYASALGEMLSVLHRVAIAQALPEAVDNTYGDKELILQLALQLPPEDVQLFYQTALLGRRDLPLAPDARAGFEMVLLRMLAFKPQGVLQAPTQALPTAKTPAQTSGRGSLTSGGGATLSERNPSLPDLGSALATNTSHPVNEVQQSAPTTALSSVQSPVDFSSAQPSVQLPVQQSPQPVSLPSSQPSSQSLAETSAPVVTQAEVGETLSAPISLSTPEQMAVENPLDQPAPSAKQANSEPDRSTLEAKVDASASISAPPFDGPYDNRAGDPGDDYAEYAATPVSYPAPSEAQHPKKPDAARTPPLDSRSVLPEAEIIPCSSVSVAKISLQNAAPENWSQIYSGLGVTGILQTTVANCQLVSRQGTTLNFVLDDSNSTLYDDSHQQRLAALLTGYFAEPVSAVIKPGKVTTETPAAQAIRQRQERQANAVVSINSDPVVRQLLEHFGGSVREDTILPLG